MVKLRCVVGIRVAMTGAINLDDSHDLSDHPDMMIFRVRLASYLE